jgi:gliding motility-associated-like protein
MNKYKLPGILFFFSSFLLVSAAGFAQITSTADKVLPTAYSSGSQDDIHVFCGAKGEQSASLTANAPIGETGSFEWLKLNAQAGSFDFFSSDLSGSSTATISNLENGCYRVNITTTSGVKTYTAWVFNNYLAAAAEISDSNCDSFTLKGFFETPAFTYVDLSTMQVKELNSEVVYKWLDGSVLKNRTVFDPPTQNTNYTFEVTDQFGCVARADVLYYSIVTKASFTFALPTRKSDPDKNEAPLTVTFTNTSANGDPGKYEWYIFKDLQKIKLEIEAKTFKDSIQEVIFSDNPVYTFEETGTYMVKLVSKKVSEFTTCTDTVYMSDYIVVGESFIDAPNVFTPDGNGSNDRFVVKFFSMKTVKITILNRWGKVLHVYENNNVQGFSDSAEASVWDGKVGGKIATPGVYYYVAEGIGRDGMKRSANGFFHLFRDR